MVKRLVLAGLFLGACSSPPEAQELALTSIPDREIKLFAGTGREDLTPPWQVSLAGYGVRQGLPFEGIHDRPQVRALYLGPAQGGVVLASAELLLIPRDLRQEVLARVHASQPGLQGLILAATHTHGGPGNYYANLLGRAAATGGYRPQVRDFLADRIAAAILNAMRNAEPARFSYAAGRAAGLNRHRRDALGQVDDEIILCRVENARDSVLAHLISFAAHPTVLNSANGLLTGDYPGFLSREVERRQGGVALFLNGAAGELAPAPPAGGRTFAGAERLGQALADRALALESALNPRHELNFGFRSRRIPLPPASLFLTPLLPDDALLQVLAVGGVRFATFPCDFGVVSGLELKQSSGALTIPISYADEYIGYAIDAQTYERGWYETGLSFFGPDLGEILVKNSLSLF